MGASPLLREMDNTEARPIVALRRVLVYGCVGISVSLFYSLAVISFVWLLHPLSPTIASIVAFVITVPAAYLAHAKITFPDSPYDTFQPLRFVLTTATSFVVSIGGMYWITEIAHRSYLLGIAWTWLMIPAMNLSIYMLWVFRTARDTGKIG
jgi:putative flippase GtrA